MKISQLGEFGLIDTLKKFAPVSKAVIKGIGDDAAVLPYSKNEYLLLTTDMLAEGTHFTRRMPPELHRAQSPGLQYQRYRGHGRLANLCGGLHRYPEEFTCAFYQRGL